MQIKARKKRITISATPEGIATAENALVSLEFDSKANFAKKKFLGKSSVDKFFTGQPIQPDTFKKICQELKLDWRVIAGIEEPESSTSRERHQEPPPAVGGEVATSHRTDTVIDARTKRVKLMVVLEGDLDDIPDPNILTKNLKESLGDSFDIVNIQRGSIRLIIEGSPEDSARLLSRFKARDLVELDGFPVKKLQILDDSNDDGRERFNNKWDLVREIVTHPKANRQLNSVDLSDADLSKSNLSKANLSEADLSEADLSGAYLSGAYLRGADLRGADLRGAYLIGTNLRGADLIGADLIGTNLTGADLRGADLIGTNLTGAYLIGADLRETDLREANLTGADLSGANLIKAKVFRTCFMDSIGISDSLKRDLIERGAIFDDSPNDRSPVPS